jgi:hypothetical protein
MVSALFWKRNKKVAIKHGFEGARELIVAWHGLRVCASASPLGGQCHFSSPRVLHSYVLWKEMHRNLFVTLLSGTTQPLVPAPMLARPPVNPGG